MFDHVTRERPSFIILNRRQNWKAVVTMQFTNGSNVPAQATIRIIGPVNSDTTQGASNQTYQSSIRDLTANVQSGLFEVGYACNPDGSRLEPITGEAWVAVCTALREAHVNKARADAAVDAARIALREAEAAATAAAAATAQAQNVFNSSL